MNRPTERPIKPHRFDMISEMCRQHFVTDQAPRCATGDVCEYDNKKDNVGCFVGFMLTHEDAQLLDNRKATFAMLLNTECRSLLAKYFDLLDPKVIIYLIVGQNLHDSYFGSPEKFTEHMRNLDSFLCGPFASQIANWIASEKSSWVEKRIL